MIKSSAVIVALVVLGSGMGNPGIGCDDSTPPPPLAPLSERSCEAFANEPYKTMTLARRTDTAENVEPGWYREHLALRFSTTGTFYRTGYVEIFARPWEEEKQHLFVAVQDTDDVTVEVTDTNAAPLTATMTRPATGDGCANVTYRLYDLDKSVDHLISVESPVAPSPSAHVFLEYIDAEDFPAPTDAPDAGTPDAGTPDAGSADTD